MEYLELLLKGLVVLFPIAFCCMLITYKWSFRKIEKEPTKVLVTGAAGQIGYAILPMIARGVMLGPDQPVTLHLFDNIKQADEALNGIKMELIDAAFPLLKGVIATTDIVEACKDVNIAVMLGGFPRKEGMERTDMMSKNVSMYMAQALALGKHAAADCKVLVFAKPSNTNALILKEFAPSISEKNITCLTRLDHNRALSQIAKRLKVHASDVKNIIIWGNHSSTHYPDVNHATFTTKDGERLVREHVADDHWERGFPWEFVLMVLMGSNLALFTLFLLDVRMENGQLCRGSRSMSSQGQRWMQRQKNSSRKHHSPSHASMNNEPIFPWRMKKT
ncbi:malate dehydrogenase, cytoplasmic-like isoform X2 [Quercus lobata]|uniref:malate dehydrogenase, cytoplasmic-like isoform X2 n=1 Tax=Quercus lobata TaxID=97700 RepID=UPI0012485FAF|nr:malate dehydrogenase, cytoplasmic-like isoform X2 [Quercus lobata]